MDLYKKILTEGKKWYITYGLIDNLYVYKYLTNMAYKIKRLKNLTINNILSNFIKQ